MGQSERTRERLVESDFAILESMTNELEPIIINKFQAKPLLIEEWPHRYLLDVSSLELELIFSQMGSFTLRLAKSERYRKNPPPIFYVSVGKYSGEYFWEDLNGKNIPLADITDTINNAIQYYKENTET